MFNNKFEIKLRICIKSDCFDDSFVGSERDGPSEQGNRTTEKTGGKVAAGTVWYAQINVFFL